MQQSDSAEIRTKSKRFTPIIAVTAHSDKTVKEKALKVGMKLVMAKPVEVQQISQVLSDWYSNE